MELLINAEIFTPRPGGRGHVLVAGDRVVWMGPEVPELPAALGATIHDLEGGRLIPGLVDGHVHLTGGGGEDGFASRVPPVPLSAFTRSGTTCVVGLLGTDDTTRATALCCRKMPSTAANPNPCPSAFVEKNGSKMRLILSRSIPQPVSRTTSST